MSANKLVIHFAFLPHAHYLGIKEHIYTQLYPKFDERQ